MFGNYFVQYTVSLFYSSLGQRENLFHQIWKKKNEIKENEIVPARFGTDRRANFVVAYLEGKRPLRRLRRR
jgi:hypothetical protein